MMGKDKWVIVIEHFLKEKYISFGLTIPFLIGICRLEEKVAPISLEDFLDLLESSLKRGFVKIIRCSFLEEDVIGLNIYRNTSWSTQVVELDEDLRKRYMSLYSDLVGQGKFSKYDGDWFPFSEEELNRIAEGLK